MFGKFGDRQIGCTYIHCRVFNGRQAVPLKISRQFVEIALRCHETSSFHVAPARPPSRDAEMDLLLSGETDKHIWLAHTFS